MAVSKRIRFEVLRRDNYTCRYCRSTEAELTIDHVTPVALGGTDDPSNLVACCKDCNAGKTSTSPDEGTVADVSDDAVRWAAARAEASKAFDSNRRERLKEVRVLLELWDEWDPKHLNLPLDWEFSVMRWLDHGLTMGRVLDAYTIAIAKPQIRDAALFAYMSGVVRNWVAEIDSRTTALLQREEAVEVLPPEAILVDFIDRFGRGLEAA